MATRSRSSALPWLGSGLLVAWAATRLDLSGAVQALAEASWLPFVVVTAAWAVVNLALESAFVALAVRWVEGVDRPLDVMRARAASYLLALVNTLLGYGGVAVWLQRRLGVPLRRGSVLMLNEALHELGAMGLLAAVLGSLAGQHLVGRIGLGCFLFYASCILTSRVTRWLGAPATPLSWFEEPRLRHYAGWLGLKVGQNLVMAAWVAAVLPLFGVRPPLFATVAGTQLVHLARAMPVAAFGVGVDQLTLTQVFAAWEPEPGRLLAFSVAFTAALFVSRAGLGLPFAPRVLHELRESR